MDSSTKAKVLRITMKRSNIGCTRRQRDTLIGLGLSRRGKTVLRNDSPSLQGMIQNVKHLIEVEDYGS
ncbi:MAG: 50S ribosomal protein L30 [Candidatus Binatia bacterium]